jgi:thimet oligopeptidase
VNFRLLPLAAACAISAGVLGACAVHGGPAAAAPLQPPGASTALTVSAAEFLAACRSDLAQSRAGMERLKALKGAGAVPTLEAYDMAQWRLGAADARAGLTHEVHPDAALREAAETCDQEASALDTEFKLDRAIYDALAGIDAKALDPAGRYYLERTLLHFRLAGVDRDEPSRKRLKELDAELTKLSQEFNRNIREGVLTLELTRADLDGLPEDFIKGHPANAAGKVILKTDNPDYVPFMSYAKSSPARERFWKLYRQRAHPKNLAVLDQMLAKRNEKARLLGFANWADYITADKMIGSGKAAGTFIDKIAVAAEARARKDYSDLLARKKKDDPAATEVKPWDAGYLNDRVKAEQYGVDSREVRPYFQYDNVKNAVLDTTGKLFGIRYQRVQDAKVWHPDVETYDVYDVASGRMLGRVYLDMFPRENKYKHYANFGLLRGKEGVALPEGALICNFPHPGPNDPGLMQHDDVTTFFHEFGHLIHGIIGGHQKWAGISGISNERDFVEAPSQMLEEWARDPKTLQSFAIHYQTKQPIPLALARKLKGADEFGKGLAVRQQMYYASVSLGYHDRDPKNLDTTQLSAQLQEKYTPYKYVPGTYFQEGFGHLDGYSAVYYTYMWSLVIAKDMYSAFSAQGDIMKPGVAMKYRHAVLEPGGSKPAAELVKDFLGRPYGFQAYEAWLNSD